MIVSRRYQGVYFAPRKKPYHRWGARVRGRKAEWVHLGYFATEKAAAFAVDVHWERRNIARRPNLTWESYR